MTHKFRFVVANLGNEIAMRASSLIHSTTEAPTHNEGHVPLMSSPHQDSVDEDLETMLDVENWEQQAAIQRSSEEILWNQEWDEHEKAIASLQLMLTCGVRAQNARRTRPPMVRWLAAHHVIQIYPPATHGAQSQNASVLHTQLSVKTNSAASSQMHEQQTGVVRTQDPTMEVEVEECDQSSTSSLRRRGAMRLWANPMFARLSYEDFHQYHAS
jgi:hypothetical protein